MSDKCSIKVMRVDGAEQKPVRIKDVHISAITNLSTKLKQENSYYSIVCKYDGELDIGRLMDNLLGSEVEYIVDGKVLMTLRLKRSIFIYEKDGYVMLEIVGVDTGRFTKLVRELYN